MMWLFSPFVFSVQRDVVQVRRRTQDAVVSCTFGEFCDGVLDWRLCVGGVGGRYTVLQGLHVVQGEYECEPDEFDDVPVFQFDSYDFAACGFVIHGVPAFCSFGWSVQ